MDSKKSCLYEKIIEDIVHKIELGEYSDNDRLPSENELVRNYSVSRITVTKALTELAEDGVIYRVQGKGSFVTPLSKRISMNHTNSTVPQFIQNQKISKVGILIPQLADNHGLNIIRAITDTLSFPEYIVSTIISKNKALEDYALNFILTNRFDAIIIFPVDSEIYNETLLSMLVNKYPFVLLDRNFYGINSNYVISNNTLGVELAANHLIELGHRNISFCSVCDTTEQATNIRSSGFTAVMKKNGLPVDPINNLTGLSTDETVSKSIVEGILTRKITAAITSNTMTTEFIYSLCHKHDIRVPEDFSIVCFDNPSIIDTKANFFTYVEQQTYQMGKSSAEIVKRLLTEKRNDATPTQMVFEPQLVVNHSTAPVIHAPIKP